MPFDLYNDPVREMDSLPSLNQKTQIWIEGKLPALTCLSEMTIRHFAPSRGPSNESWFFLWRVRTDVHWKTQCLSYAHTHHNSHPHFNHEGPRGLWCSGKRDFHSEKNSFWFPGSVPSSAVQLWPSFRTSLSWHFFIDKTEIIIWLNSRICCEEFMK